MMARRWFESGIEPGVRGILHADRRGRGTGEVDKNCRSPGPPRTYTPARLLFSPFLTSLLSTTFIVMVSSPYEPVARPPWYPVPVPPSVPPHLRHLPPGEAVAASLAEFEAELSNHGFKAELDSFARRAGITIQWSAALVHDVDDVGELPFFGPSGLRAFGASGPFVPDFGSFPQSFKS